MVSSKTGGVHGGKMEAGETPEEAALKREIREELSTEINGG